MIDITNPDAAAWMWKRYQRAAEQGVTGWWLDLGEPEKDDTTTHYTLGNREEVHNEYASRWMDMLYSGTRREFPSFRPVLMTRSGTSGMQRYGVMPWTGDIARSWAGLHAQIPAMINTGMSGVAYMGSDVGGFASDGTANPRLYLRWVEQAVFGGMLRTHSAVLPEPYHECYDSIRDDVRRFVHLHYKYLPYTYNLSYENATCGLPPARPVSFYHPTSETASVTGDMGVIDSEGFIFLRGRNKCMILGPSGQNIYPEEIEGVINNVRYVVDSLVIEDKGLMTALIYPDFAQAQADGLDAEALEKFLNEAVAEASKDLANYSRVKKIEIMPEDFERTPKKSIKRYLYQRQ